MPLSVAPYSADAPRIRSPGLRLFVSCDGLARWWTSRTLVLLLMIGLMRPISCFISSLESSFPYQAFDSVSIMMRSTVFEACCSSAVFSTLSMVKSCPAMIAMLSAMLSMFMCSPLASAAIRCFIPAWLPSFATSRTFLGPSGS